MNIFELLQKDRLFHYYQPLHHLADDAIYGYEALLRSTIQSNPEALFKTAKESNILYKLDTVSIEKAFAHYSHQSHNQKLFLNMFMSTLLHPNFIRFMVSMLERHAQSGPSIVFEMNEAKEEASMWESPLLSNRIALLRKMGIQFAIDDFGQGATSLKKAVEMEPEYLKLDRYFATDLASNDKKQKLVSLFTEYFKGDTTVVLEGIETAEDLHVATEIGIDVAQGYYIGKPASLITG
ncbi:MULTISPECIES: EAL domain-containing protein [Pontibacillus]|uniref:EAL domain-containing protein n=1 Tax=Pontibacillus chungwhensis TaxID=265426 RepID=A0ABY8UX07_9BACI|nr:MULTISPECIES: EAL domain-containing protein [Pontibacillus]MCD5325733.1 EAL domain-containing protein [Pontibacillus sp. HN14]WIF98029.1 EAL domain-containing protein [Pontibacillus chungwhensis]